ncbi:MAG: segregation/condensation protein A [Anaerolineaceae bacterium]|nr:segregation/condensation protein A [Anaerolineaceae bacterium]
MQQRKIPWRSNPIEINTPLYDGPLDLLLGLIDRAELDITKLAVSKVTEQFLTYLDGMEERDPDEISAFLVMAARLLLIKSSVLLPQPSNLDHTPEEDPGDLLIQQLLEYQKYKKAGIHLESLESSGLKSYLRLSTTPIIYEPKLDLDGITLIDLKDAVLQVLHSNMNTQDLEQVVTMSRSTIREKIKTIMKSLKSNESTNFNALLENRSRVEIVVTFLALLELIKQNIVEARQERLFKDIEMIPGEELDHMKDFDLEFEV